MEVTSGVEIVNQKRIRAGNDHPQISGRFSVLPSRMQNSLLPAVLFHRSGTERLLQNSLRE
jgi:hypothetical protein